MNRILCLFELTCRQPGLEVLAHARVQLPRPSQGQTALRLLL